ncbi:MAG: hypothetical protein ACD_80C00210G0001 [uncultured bacterium (gcode 4)]|uniref:Uncharacterized protein n=1 Tax=uncultured bacterium (gcode 4) TaxID=1234023 RepID=K1XHH8_9BACT|nr:MAG: hypothetical protein ACD_80C00210G0001 [uncultured bacterium (gcode 4)]
MTNYLRKNGKKEREKYVPITVEIKVKSIPDNFPASCGKMVGKTYPATKHEDPRGNIWYNILKDLVFEKEKKEKVEAKKGEEKQEIKKEEKKQEFGVAGMGTSSQEDLFGKGKEVEVLCAPPPKEVVKKVSFKNRTYIRLHAKYCSN